METNHKYLVQRARSGIKCVQRPGSSPKRKEMVKPVILVCCASSFIHREGTEV